MGIDLSRDSLLSDFGKVTLFDRYLLPEEISPQQGFYRAAHAFASNKEHGDRIYDYVSKLWLSFATPILSNGGTDRGLPISCFAGYVEDTRKGILEHISEISWLSSYGGGTAGYWGELRSNGTKTSHGTKSTGIIPFIKMVESSTLAFQQGGCYAEGTEVLTDRGWIDFNDLNEFDKVAQVNDDLTTTFVKPMEYFKFPVKDKMVRITTPNKSINLLVTKNHSMVIKKPKDLNLTLIEADDVKYYKGIKHFNNAKLVNSEKVISWYQRFLIAYQADGCLIKKVTGELSGCNAVSFHLSKQRKIDKLDEILSNLNFEYTKSQKKNSVSYYIKIPKNYQLTKDLSWVDFNTIDGLWCEQFLDELKNWDASDKSVSNRGVIYSNTDKFSVDIVHAVAVLAGKTTRFKEVIRELPRKTIFTIYIRDSKPLDGNNIVKEYVDYDGFVYCVAVETKKLLVRYEGVVSVCGNTRRAGYAAYLDVSHPEILEFISIRKPTGGDVNRKCLELHNAVCITDKFMEAVKDNKDWELIDPHTSTVTDIINSRDLLIQLLDLRLKTGEPYFWFTDTVQRNQHPSHIAQGLFNKHSNLCSEISLPTNEDRTFVCCLSSLNLEKWEEWKDNEQFIDDVVEYLDNVMEFFIKNAPDHLNKAKYSASMERSLGLGTLGWHSLLQSKLIPFEGPLAVGLNNKIYSHIKEKALEATKRLAKERGAAPDYLNHPIGDPVRNMHLMAIAPNASSSIICGETSPSVEPWKANVFVHKTTSGSFLVKNKFLEKLLEEKKQNNQEVWQTIIDNDGSVQHLEFLSDWEKSVFKTALEIDQHWLVELAAGRQKYICQAQSINLFFPADVDVEYVLSVHYKAWKDGLKSLYYLRSTTLKTVEKVSQKVERVEKDEHVDNNDGNEDTCFSCSG